LQPAASQFRTTSLPLPYELFEAAYLTVSPETILFSSRFQLLASPDGTRQKPFLVGIPTNH
jgi:hypothetical protein